KRLPEQLSQLGVNRLWIIITEEAETRVDLFLHYHAVRFRETRQYLDQQRQQIWPLRNAAGLAQCPAHPTAASSSHAIRKGGHPLHSAVRSEEHTSELQSRGHLVCRLLLEKKKHIHCSRRTTNTDSHRHQ